MTTVSFEAFIFPNPTTVYIFPLWCLYLASSSGKSLVSGICNPLLFFEQSAQGLQNTLGQDSVLRSHQR